MLQTSYCYITISLKLCSYGWTRCKTILKVDQQVFMVALLVSKCWWQICHTGVKGWYPIYLPSTSPMRVGDVAEVVGGLELSIKFSEAEDRDHVIHLSRGVGWSPLPEIDFDEDWLDKEDLSKEKHWEFCLNINKAWIPSSELHYFYVSATKLDKNVKAYVRYKLYNKGTHFCHI